MTVPHPALHQTYLATRHFGSLDGLRFLCISAVIWHHVPLWTELNSIAGIFVRGHVGVDFFFVLSGYLITTLLLREEAAKGRFSLRGFYWRRILRIVPVYFFVVSLAAFYAIVVKGRTGDLELLPYYYLFLSNFLSDHIPLLTPTWSLAMEEQYYLIWPMLLLLIPRRWIVPVLLAMIGVNLAGVLGALTPLGITAVELGPLNLGMPASTYAPILMGSLAAVLLHKRTSFDRIAPFLSVKAAPWLCLATLLWALSAFPGALIGWPNLVVHALMTLTVISLVVREDNGLAPILKLRPIERIGQISYGIYLYHLFALSLVVKLFEVLGIESWWAVLFIYYALSILIAEISFRTLEAWFMGFRHKTWGQVRAS